MIMFRSEIFVVLLLWLRHLLVTLLTAIVFKQIFYAYHFIKTHPFMHLFYLPELLACPSSPCLNGATCFERFDSQGYLCICPPGFGGEMCQIDIDLCASDPCVNGATCSENNDSSRYMCTCPYGYEGENCKIDIDFCVSDPCLNGATCTDLVSGYECTCPMGYGGTNCEIGKILKGPVRDNINTVKFENLIL